MDKEQPEEKEQTETSISEMSTINESEPLKLKVTVLPSTSAGKDLPEELHQGRVNAFLVYQPSNKDDSVATYKLEIDEKKPTFYPEKTKKQLDVQQNAKKHIVSSDLSSSGVIGHWRVTDKGIEYICDLDSGKCKRAFTSIGYLKSHQHGHFSRDLVCHICERRFTSAHHLGYHLKVHNGEKEFKCTAENCDKSFYTAQQQNVHMRTHTGVKPFACDTCKKGFTTLQNLTNHMRTHTGEKPYACDYDGCNKKFAELSSLKKHLLIHTGEKPHVCPHCKKGFTQIGTLKWHVRRYHTENPPLRKSIANIQAQQKAIAEARAKVKEIAERNNRFQIDHRKSIAYGKEQGLKEKTKNAEFQYVDMELLQAANLGRKSPTELTNPENSPFMIENSFSSNVIVLHQDLSVIKPEAANYSVDEGETYYQIQNNNCCESTYDVNASSYTADQDEDMKDADYNEMYVEMTDDVQNGDYNIYIGMSEETIIESSIGQNEQLSLEVEEVADT